MPMDFKMDVKHKKMQNVADLNAMQVEKRLRKMLEEMEKKGGKHGGNEGANEKGEGGIYCQNEGKTNKKAFVELGPPIVYSVDMEAVFS